MGSSTWPGEEEILLQSYISLLRRGYRLSLLLAPRHMERADAVEKLIKEYDCLPIRRTVGFEDTTDLNRAYIY